MQERFSDHLRALGDSIWEAQRNHPFVRGVGDGTLEVERLKFWVRQDYLYLIDYARVYNLAAAKAPGPELSAWLTFHADYTLNKEMALHRSYARDFGIGVEELVAEKKAPTCQAYTDFLDADCVDGAFRGDYCGPSPVLLGLLRDGEVAGGEGDARGRAVREVDKAVHGP